MTITQTWDCRNLTKRLFICGFSYLRSFILDCTLHTRKGSAQFDLTLNFRSDLEGTWIKINHEMLLLLLMCLLGWDHNYYYLERQTFHFTWIRSPSHAEPNEIWYRIGKGCTQIYVLICGVEAINCCSCSIKKWIRIICRWSTTYLEYFSPRMHPPNYEFIFDCLFSVTIYSTGHLISHCNPMLSNSVIFTRVFHSRYRLSHALPGHVCVH